LKALNTVITVLAWILFGIVLYAIWPFLMKLLTAAQHLHNLGI
jgi:hypothetical protein